MTASDRLRGDELINRMQERINELEKANKELRAEFLEREQKEHRIHRYNHVLEGINRIFGTMVKAETKEELGTALLSVVIEVTGSQIGFVSEVSDDGLMHDIAISSSGWDKCLMFDKTGHRCLRGDHVLQGLYGRVINSGKSFFTNDPQGHPDISGFPEGHPPLRSFLGVPLILEEKTIGILGVANREGGYGPEQQEDLEALAPAVVQVLQRKNEEQSRKLAEKAFKGSRAKLEAALGSMTDAVIISDARGRFIDFNDAFVTFHRFGSREECSRTFAKYPDILDVFMAGGTPAPVDMWALPRALRGEVATDAEYILRRKDTGETWVGSYSFAPIRNEEGSIVGAVVIGRDITERKHAEKALREVYEQLRVQSEELQAQAKKLQVTNEVLRENEARLRIIVANSPDIIFEQDRNLRYVWIYNPAPPITVSDVMGKTDADLLPPGQAQQLESIKRRVLDTGKREQTLLHLSPGGEPGWFEAIYEPRFDDTGKVIGILSYTRDVTERKNLEEQIRRQAEETEKIMEVAPVAIWIGHDPQSRRITGNRMANEFYEAEVGENVSANVTSVRRFFYEGRELAASELPMQQASLKEIEVRNVEFDVLLQRGECRTLIGSASPLHDSEGNVRGSVGAFIDITERKQAEEALRQSEKMYRNIVETASEGIWIGDLEARTIYVNERMTEMLGYTQEEMLGKFAWDFADKEGKSIIKKNIEKRRYGLDESYEFKFKHKNGSPLWAIVSSKSLFDDHGRFTGSMSMLTDITERKEAETRLKETLDNLECLVKERTVELERAYNSLKESEERYRSFIENFKGIAFQADENFVPVFLHGTVEEITGYREEEFMSRDLWKDIIHPEDLPRIYKDEKKVRNSPYRASGEIDFRINRRDGKTKWVHEIYQKIPGSKGNPDRYQGAIYDITERKEAEGALAKMEKIRIKEIHHRIKNNLQVISSLLDLQAEAFSHLETCKTPEVVEAFMESQNRIISMALIHEELYKGDEVDTLDFAAYLKKLTEDLFSSYKPGNKDISFKLDLDKVYLGMDTSIPLGIIVNELVSNSFKHAFPAGVSGEIRITLSKNETFTCKNGTPGPDELFPIEKNFSYILKVVDNGIGIPWEIDFQSTESLGLQLVNILVEQVEGYIELKRNKGTEFTIWFNNLER